MEMQEITPDEKKSDEKEDDAGTSKSAVETKTEEEAEADHYSKLLAQPEDIYSEAFYSGVPLKKEADVKSAKEEDEEEKQEEEEEDEEAINKSSIAAVVSSRWFDPQCFCTEGGCVLKRQTLGQTGQEWDTDPASYQDPTAVFSMYIKFCRSYGEDKKGEASAGLSPQSKLSVELDKAKPTDGNIRRYRAVCALLSGLCLILLLVVIVLCLKLQNGSTVCPGTEGATGDSSVQTCSYEQCRTHIQIHNQGCHHCPQGWVVVGSSCFLLSTTRLDWAESQRNCSSRGASLAIITKQEEQKLLTKEGNMKYWIGLRKDGASSTWIDNSALRLSYWAIGYPGQGKGCGLLNAQDPPEKNWNIADCKAYTYFICQLQLA
ncbi:uncharacterized protein V6R79_001214 [Siganus canaliculatus]